MPEDGPAFEQVLDAVGALPDDDEQRNVMVRSVPVRLHELTASAQRRQGELVKIRMDEIPVRASLSGELETFDLDEDEGIGEETAFLYHSGLQVLVLQRNRTGVSNYGFAEYFQTHAEELLEMDGWMKLLPVIEPETMALLRQVSVVRKFDVRFAGVHDPRGLLPEAAPAPGVSRMLDLIDIFDAPSARIELSMGHEREGSLDVERVKRAARRLLQIDAQENVDGSVKRIEIRGSTEDEEPVLLDLLRDRMIETASIELDADRRLPYERRRQALREAYTGRQDQLRALFGRPEEE